MVEAPPKPEKLVKLVVKKSWLGYGFTLYGGEGRAMIGSGWRPTKEMAVRRAIQLLDRWLAPDQSEVLQVERPADTMAEYLERKHLR